MRDQGGERRRRGDGLMLLRELSQCERQRQESQIEALRQESERAQIHVSFSLLR